MPQTSLLIIPKHVFGSRHSCISVVLQAAHGRALLGPITDAIGNITGGVIEPHIGFQNGSVQIGVDYKGPLGILQGTSSTAFGL